MIITTMNDLPGYRIDEVIGEVFGLTVRSRGVKGQLGASFKSMFGGELGSLTQMLAEGREEGIQRLVAEAAEQREGRLLHVLRGRSEEVAPRAVRQAARIGPGSSFAAAVMKGAASGWRSSACQPSPSMRQTTT